MSNGDDAADEPTDESAVTEEPTEPTRGDVSDGSTVQSEEDASLNEDD